MKKRERLEMLFNAIVSQNLITTKEFIDFAVSKEIKYLTATRDLKELEQLEYIKVVHDHIEISNASLESPMHSYRYVLNVEEKTKIAARAVEFLEEEDVVYISSGTTCEWLVKQIKTDVALVVTNGLAVFNTCLNNEHIKETILLGGHLRRKTLAFYGGDTLEILSRYRFTKAFLTATSMQNNLELFISSESEASIFSKAVSLAKKSFLVMDSTKLVEDQGSRFVTDLSDIDYLITDDNIDNEIRELIASKTNLIVVK